MVGKKSFNYKKYLASREWALKREAVRQRCGDRCERCEKRKMTQVHHTSYEHLGAEPLEELQGICAPCHMFLSAKTDIDPIQTGYFFYHVALFFEFGTGKTHWNVRYFPCSLDRLKKAFHVFVRKASEDPTYLEEVWQGVESEIKKAEA